jgi:hypothetical protein
MREYMTEVDKLFESIKKIAERLSSNPAKVTGYTSGFSPSPTPKGRSGEKKQEKS